MPARRSPRQRNPERRVAHLDAANTELIRAAASEALKPHDELFQILAPSQCNATRLDFANSASIAVSMSSPGSASVTVDSTIPSFFVVSFMVSISAW